MGDDKAVLHYLTEAAQERWFAPSHLSLFPMPNVDDVTAHLLGQDVAGAREIGAQSPTGGVVLRVFAHWDLRW
jgi:hypothetical protein